MAGLIVLWIAGSSVSHWLCLQAYLRANPEAKDDVRRFFDVSYSFEKYFGDGLSKQQASIRRIRLFHFALGAVAPIIYVIILMLRTN